MSPEAETRLEAASRRDPRLPTRAALDAAIAALPECARTLARVADIHVVALDDVHVDEDLAWEIAKQRGARLPSVTHLRRDRSVVVAVGDVGDLGHEMIHVAQVHAGGRAMRLALEACADEGEAVLRAAEGRARTDPAGAKEAHRDVEWVRKAVAMDMAERPLEDQGGRHGGSFDMHRLVHPTEGTAGLGRALGLDPCATAVCVYAAQMRRAGVVDAGGAVAREIVAYRHQDDPGALADLFADATNGATLAHGAGLRRTCGAIDPKRHDALLEERYGAGDVEIEVGRADVGRALVAPRRTDGVGEAPHEALRRLAHAVRQPYGKDGARLRGTTGLLAAYEADGDADGPVRVRLGREALAHHLAQDERAWRALEAFEGKACTKGVGDGGRDAAAPHPYPAHDAALALGATPHPGGGTMRGAFTLGRCHAFAIATQALTGGPMMALTPIGEPDHLVHVGVLHRRADGSQAIVDADGVVPIEVWRARWEHVNQDPDLRMREVGEDDLHRMMPHRPATPHEIDAARPLADAVAATRDGEMAAWLVARREGVTAPLTRAEVEGVDLTGIERAAHKNAQSREGRRAAGTSVAEIMHARELADWTTIEKLPRTAQDWALLRVSRKELADALSPTPGSAPGKALASLVHDVRVADHRPGHDGSTHLDGREAFETLHRGFGTALTRRLEIHPGAMRDALRGPHGASLEEMVGRSLVREAAAAAHPDPRKAKGGKAQGPDARSR